MKIQNLGHLKGLTYVAECGNHRTQKFNDPGTPLLSFGSQGSEDGQFHTPTGIAVDSTGNIYVTEYRNYRVQKFGYYP